ncbi:MAG: TetR/AcrR family transcriptional regulator [Bacillus sp. (in: firmicutes)]
MNKKEMKRSRMWKYFIDATSEIIETEGIDKVTIRKVADKAGYNSATIYNYFSEVSHLIFFASMKFLKEYTEDVSVQMGKGKNSLEKYLLAWESFCKHSFRQPQIFHAIFIMDLGDNPENLLEHYYQLYPADLTNIDEHIKPILVERNLWKRGKSILELAQQEGLLKAENVEAVNEMTILIWQGMFTNVLNNRKKYTTAEAANVTLKYINELVASANSFNFSVK